MTRSLNNSPSKIISLLSSNDNLQSSCNSLSAPADTKYSSCPIMITPSAPLLSSTLSDLYSGKNLKTSIKYRNIFLRSTT
jgi:hypothetical protein